MKKEIIILGDVEMGGGTLTDDFIADATLARLIHSYTKKKIAVDLIFNGDTFDFLKCPYIKGGIKSYPRHITEEISHIKLHMIYAAHKLVFDALRLFVKNKTHRIYFIIGNHDQDLFFEEIQNELKNILGSKDNVFFAIQYNEHGVYAEHGQQYDFLNKVNPKHIFLNYNGKPILNAPWISFGVMSRFTTVKDEHPFLERIKPIPTLFALHETIMKQLTRTSIWYFFKSIVYYPLRYYYDPTYTFPRVFLGEFYHRWRKFHFEVDHIVEKFKKKKKGLFSQNKIFVLGHIHEHYREEEQGWVIIHPDTWRDEYTLDKATQKLISKPKRYVQIIVDDDKPLSWKVIDVPVKRSIFDFNEVVRDEKKYVLLAAKEEGFKQHMNCNG